ncbi:MAG: beta-N-acetylhexosaminidase [Beijerinckiaceae bacterium]
MTRAFICGCSGTALSNAERSFLREAEPFGLILFKRNIESPAQVRALVEDVRDCLGRTAAILVDQEGGRVQRLGPPQWRVYPAAASFGTLKLPIEEVEALVFRVAQIMASDLLRLGITIDCLPVLDVPVQGSHGVIGDRAYGDDPKRVAQLGRAAAEGLIAGGVLPVMKHVPGHGRATLDSHLELPRVDAPLDLLLRTDFMPFIENADLPAAMTAHVVYSALDPDRPATVSPRVIGHYIRGIIGFDGLLLSDDLSMQALQGTLAERTAAAFAAGIDLALHCNGDLAEAARVAAAAPFLEGPALIRAGAAMARLPTKVAVLDPVEAWAEVEALLAIAG